MKILFHRNFKVSTFKLDLGSNFTPLFAAIFFRSFVHLMIDCPPELLVIGDSVVRSYQDMVMQSDSRA